METASTALLPTCDDVKDDDVGVHDVARLPSSQPACIDAVRLLEQAELGFHHTQSELSWTGSIPLPTYSDVTNDITNDVDDVTDGVTNDVDDMPPDYETVMAEGGASCRQGDVAGAFTDIDLAATAADQQPRLFGVRPQLHHVDFCPGLIKPGDRESPPQYRTFRSMIEDVNRWLSENAMYRVLRAESIEYKVDEQGHLEADHTIYHEPLNGGIMYARGLRLWLLTKTLLDDPCVDHIDYTDIFPQTWGHDLDTMVGLFNTQQEKHPLPVIGRGVTSRDYHLCYSETPMRWAIIGSFKIPPSRSPTGGRVLTLETLRVGYKRTFRSREYDSEESLRCETSRTPRNYVVGLRCFFIRGEPRHERIGVRDFVPRILSQATGFARFESFSAIFREAAEWISQHNKKDVSLTNIQTVEVKVEKQVGKGVQRDERFMVESRKSNFNEEISSQYVKVVRVCYTLLPERPEEDGESIPTPGQPAISTRLFVPVRMEDRLTEPLTQTIERMNAWLQLTGVHVIGAESLEFELNPTLTTMHPEEISTIAHRGNSHYWVSAIRLYFENQYMEPPPYLLPPAFNYAASWKACDLCTIS